MSNLTDTQKQIIRDNANLVLMPGAREVGKLWAVNPNKASGAAQPVFDVARNCKRSEIDSELYIRQVVANMPAFTYTGTDRVISLDVQSTNKYLYPFAAEYSYSTKSGLSVELDASTAGSEKVTNGDFSAWTSDNPDGWSIPTEDANNYVTESSGAARIVSDGSTMYMIQSCVTSGKSYLITVKVTDVSSGSIKIYVDGNSSTPYIISATGTYSFYQYASGSNLVIGRNTACDVTIDSISVKEVSGFASPFKDSSGNIELVARKLVEDGSTGTHKSYRIFTGLTDGNSYTRTVIAKYNGRHLRVGFPSYVEINLETEAEISRYSDTSEPIDDVEVKELADGYYSVSLTVTLNGKTSLQQVIYPTQLSGGNSYTGDGTSGVYIAGIQFEEQSAATSFINDPSAAEGSEVTRLGDHISGATYSGDGTSVSIFFDGTYSKAANGGIRLYGSGGDAINCYMNSTYIIFYLVIGGSTMESHQINIGSDTDKIVITVEGSNVYSYLNGVKTVESTSFTGFSNNSFDTFNLSNTGADYRGEIDKIVISSAMTDAQAETLTQ